MTTADFWVLDVASYQNSLITKYKIRNSVAATACILDLGCSWLPVFFSTKTLKSQFGRDSGRISNLWMLATMFIEYRKEKHRKSVVAAAEFLILDFASDQC